MAAIMVVYMKITDTLWVDEYFKAVPTLIADHGGKSIAGGRDLHHLEGSMDIDRVAILQFPSLEAAKGFWNDVRYTPYKAAREAGTESEIFVFDNAVIGNSLV